MEPTEPLTVTFGDRYVCEMFMVQAQPCRVYWRSHGCDRPRGHRGSHIHICDCGDQPRPDDILYGDDVPLAAVIALVEALEVDC